MKLAFILRVAMPLWLGVVMPAAMAVNLKPARSDIAFQRKSVKLERQDILLVVSKDGNAALRFTAFGPKNGVSTYEWRFQPADGGDESRGTGTVFEKYITTRTSPGQYNVEDAGSQLHIIAGAIRLEWSYGSRSSGWIYYNPYLHAARILSDVSLEEIDLRGRRIAGPTIEPAD